VAEVFTQSISEQLFPETEAIGTNPSDLNWLKRFYLPRRLGLQRDILSFLKLAS
jgi:hypothetical protein